MDAREAKALEIAARMRIVFKDGAWIVPSMSGAGDYKVVLKPDGHTCNCPDFELRARPCKHILAAQFVCERDFGGQPLVINTDTLPAKKTYKQDWPAYTLSQRIEKRRVQELLADLCGGIQEPPQPKSGRRRTLMCDMLFTSVYKVYCAVSSRRFGTDLEEAYTKGHLTQCVHPVTVCAFLENPAMTPFLRELIAKSALPLRAVETDFAVDSSGFSTCRYERWFDHKYGVQRAMHHWVKVHIACGVKTNVITAASIYGRDANDSPILPELVKKTAEGFQVNEVSADKGYISVENVETVVGVGGTPFIAFKSNSTGGAGGLFEKMFHYYSFNRQQFLEHYHKRSNVESTFSMIKRKFGDAVRSKTDVAMENEAYCKLLAHNLCCLIASQCELGIEATFWPEREEEQQDVLPMARPG